MEIARIPETSLNISGGSEAQPAPQTPATQSRQISSTPAHSPEPAVQAASKPDSSAHNVWLWISGVLALGWLSTLIYFLRSRKQSGKDDKKATEQAQRELRLKEITKKLKDACNKNDVQSAKSTLLVWGKQNFNANNLGTITNHCEARLRDEIIKLNQALYGKTAESWNGKQLFQAFSENNVRAKISRGGDDALEPLHRL